MKMKRLPKLRTTAIARGGLVLFAAMTFTNVINFLFQTIVGRELGPAEYGELGPLTGVLAIFSVPSAALQVVITARVAGRLRDSEGKPVPLVVGPLLGQAVVWGVGLTVILVLCAPLLQSFFHLSSIIPALLLAVYVLPTLIDLVPRAVLLGELRFIRLSVALIAGSSVRLGAAILLTPSRGVSGAMAASVLGALVTAALVLHWVRPFINHVPGGDAIRVTWRAASAALVALSGFWIFSSADVFLGRHFLSAHDSGLYVAATTVASAAMFIAGAVAAVALPRFAAAHGVGPAARAALFQALGITAALGGIAALFFALNPQRVTSVLFGSSFESSGNLLGILGFSAAMMSLIFVLMQFHLSSHSSRSAALPWLGITLASVGIVLFHDSLSDVGFVKLAVTIIVFLLMLVLALGRNEPPPAPDATTGQLWAVEKSDLDLTMVVPYYNPGPLLRTNIENLVRVLKEENARFEIIAVSDGATDGSEKSLDGFDPELVRSVVLPTNSGKGQALRVGFAMSRGNYIGFIDADGDVDPTQLHPYLSIVHSYSPDIVLGSKRHPMSDVSYPPIRRVYSWGYQQMIRILFRLNIRDTQTGLKIIRREALAQILPRMVEKRFAFDLELFVVARHLGFRKFFEAPVTIKHQFTSTVSSRAVKGTLLDTLAIFYRLHFLGYYDRARHGAATQAPEPPDLAKIDELPGSLV